MGIVNALGLAVNVFVIIVWFFCASAVLWFALERGTLLPVFCK